MDDAEIKEKIYEYVKNAKTRQKPSAVAKAVAEELGIDKKHCKTLMEDLTKEGRLIYTYYGSSFIELPPEKGSERI